MINLKIKILRILRGLSQQELANEFSASKFYIHSKESGKRSITVEEIQKLSSLFHVPSEIFFYDQEGFIGYLYSAFDPEEVDRVLEQVMQVEKAGV